MNVAKLKTVLAVMPLLALAATGSAQVDAPAASGDYATDLAPNGREAIEDMPNYANQDAERCRMVINQVRGERGLPHLQRETADSAPVTLTAAVDRRIDGCHVLVPLNDPDSIRPIPKPQNEPQLRRIPVQAD